MHVIGPTKQYLMLRHIAASGASVVIDGRGGDEIMSGYIWFVPLVLKAIEALGIDPAQFRSRINEWGACLPSTRHLFDSIVHNIPQWVTAFPGRPRIPGCVRCRHRSHAGNAVVSAVDGRVGAFPR